MQATSEDASPGTRFADEQDRSVVWRDEHERPLDGQQGR